MSKSAPPPSIHQREAAEVEATLKRWLAFGYPSANRIATACTSHLAEQSLAYLRAEKAKAQP